MGDYVRPSKIKLSPGNKQAPPNVGINQESVSSIVPPTVPPKTPHSTLILSHLNTLKTNRRYFAGIMLNTEDEDEEFEYPGINVPRRSERYGPASLVQPLGKSSSVKSLIELMDETSSLSCLDRFLFKFCKPCQPTKSFHHSAEGIKTYMNALDTEWSPILALFEWPKLPGGQHKKARGFNYVTHSIWILAYAAGTASSSDNDKEEFYRECFENMLLQAEMIGILLQNFVSPVNELEKLLQPLDDLTTLMDVKLMTPVYFGVDAGEIFDEAIIPDSRRYKMRDYIKLKIYTRDVQDMEWVEFHDLRFRDQMTRVQNGLTDIVVKLKMILGAMPSVLKLIKSASGKKSRGLPVLLPHMIRMRNSLNTLLQSAKLSPDNSKMMRSIFIKTQQNVQSVIEQAVFSMTNIWEVILMTRLAYNYVATSAMSNGSMSSLEEVIKRLSNSDKRLSPNVDYKWKQFYDVNCASLLRKVPVIVRNSVEMAIHLDGFSNPEAQIPSKKSLYTRQSQQIDTPMVLPIKQLLQKTPASEPTISHKPKVIINV